MKKSVKAELYNKDYYLYPYSKDINTFIEKTKERMGRGAIEDSFMREMLHHAGLDKNKKARVLDVGCGRGDLVFSLASLGHEAKGIDYSQDAISIAEIVRKGLPEEVQKNSSFSYMDAKEMAIENEFDAVIMDDIVEHLHDWELLEMFKNVSCALKPGGILVVFTKPNKNWIRFGYPIKRVFAIPKTLYRKTLERKKRVYASEYERKESEKKSWKEIQKRNEPFIIKLAHYVEIFYQRDFYNYAPEMHVNETTPRHLRRLLRKHFQDVRVWCTDSSRNVFSMLAKSFWGPHIWAVAAKKAALFS